MNTIAPTRPVSRRRQQWLGPLWRFRNVGFKIGLGLAALGACIVLGEKVAHELPRLEQWIAGLGAWGPAAFVISFIVLSSVFVPDTLFAVAAGVMFGLVRGSIIMCAAGILGAVIDFWLARYLFRGRITRALAGYPKLEAIARAAGREGLKFHLLLRLTPVNPTTLSYVLGGATPVGFGMFFVAAFGHIPGYVVEVYFGYVAQHVTRMAGGGKHHSTAHLIVSSVGLVLSVVAMVVITQHARKAIAAAEARDGAAMASNLS